jgi:hypothetical protein
LGRGLESPELRFALAALFLLIAAQRFFFAAEIAGDLPPKSSVAPDAL